MASIQRRILDNCAEFVRDGGIIVYCTCSITREENEMVVRDFMQAHPAFDMVESRPRLGLTGLMGQSGAQRLYPHLHRCNGFYIARLEKASD
jgi:16S rRNA (cytosine967-C5)-methyltransferase